jgi:hypothetical protein
MFVMAGAQVARLTEWNGGLIMPERVARDRPKLGSSALLALALGKEPLFSKYQSVYDALYRSLLAARKPSGRFITHFGFDVEHVRSSAFYSGQALLTLVQRGEKGDADSRELCAESFATYRKQFHETPVSAFVGWHVDLWSRMAKLCERQEYADFVFEQADWLLQRQIISDPRSGRVGGFAKRGRTPNFSSIVFLEAVVRAYGLAQVVSDRKRIRDYRQAIEAGLQFCACLRLGEDQMAWFPDPLRSRGGIALSRVDRRVRCDIPQHFITLCLGLLDCGW